MDTSSDPSNSWDALRQLEKKLGFRLPEAYAMAMHAHNGGELPTEQDLWELYPIPGWPEKRVGHNAYGDVLTETAARQGQRLFPDGAVAIADNGLGDQLCFLPEQDGGSNPSTSRQDTPSLAPGLWFWQHDTGRLEKVANAFADLERVH